MVYIVKIAGINTSILRILYLKQQSSFIKSLFKNINIINTFKYKSTYNLKKLDKNFTLSIVLHLRYCFIIVAIKRKSINNFSLT